MDKLTLDFAQLIVVGIGALIGIVWNNLNEKIKTEAEKTKGSLVSTNEILKARVDSLEKDLGTIPTKLDFLTRQLQTLELNINNQFATKTEVVAHDRKLDEFLKHALEVLKSQRNTNA